MHYRYHGGSKRNASGKWEHLPRTGIGQVASEEIGDWTLELAHRQVGVTIKRDQYSVTIRRAVARPRGTAHRVLEQSRGPGGGSKARRLAHATCASRSFALRIGCGRAMYRGIDRGGSSRLVRVPTPESYGSSYAIAMTSVRESIAPRSETSTARRRVPASLRGSNAGVVSGRRIVPDAASSQRRVLSRHTRRPRPLANRWGCRDRARGRWIG